MFSKKDLELIDSGLHSLLYDLSRKKQTAYEMMGYYGEKQNKLYELDIIEYEENIQKVKKLLHEIAWANKYGDTVVNYGDEFPMTFNF